MRWLALLVVAAGTAMCAYEKKQQASEQASSVKTPREVYRRDMPAAPSAQVPFVLEREARRRHQRFINAVNPGDSFNATRLTQQSIDDGAYSAEQLYDVGGQLFHHRFERRDGFGAGEGADGHDGVTLRRVHDGMRGGPDAYSCADCHRRGGIAGAGDASDNAYYQGDGDRPGSAFERNPIALAGAGLVALVAQEMTADLQTQRDQLIGEAKRTKAKTSRELLSKGVSFGELQADGRGRINYDKLRGVDRDLVIKPFGWKGHHADLREMVEQQLALHHGMQSQHLVRQHLSRQQALAKRKKKLNKLINHAPALGPFGGKDPDGDGVVDEIGEGQLSALTLFIAMQEVPQQLPPPKEKEALWAEGKKQFGSLGCARCHTPSLPLRSTVFELPSRVGGKPLRIDLAKHGATPRLMQAPDGSYHVQLFSDLRRHIVGPYLRDRRPRFGVRLAQFLTRPLWGLLRSGPYLHDARSPTFQEAILEHDGEAAAERDAFAKLSDRQRAPLRVYLTSLTRLPTLQIP